ncbi:hypothetical protein BCR34DRAFT_577625 [Clohesyomyces aquaticus]|uniref:Uncharacterized protein n=1 Tax=Clohesyomyces aquaticus TaxID=1231657 RepID=A0A1Y1YK48_9PLEO|nr:hypothetical protein BCR34DRAFT_577625 [Clohesyomyces aquaticus]
MIPSSTRSLQRRTTQACLDTLPFFTFEQHFENGSEYHALSTGAGLYISHDKVPQFQDLKDRAAFSVCKQYETGLSVVRFRSERLKLCLWSYGFTRVDDTYEIHQLIKHYDKLYAVFESRRETKTILAGELQLFVHDFLSDHAIYDGLDIEVLHRTGILSCQHWQNIQEWKATMDLRDLERAFDESNSHKARQKLKNNIGVQGNPESERSVYETRRRARLVAILRSNFRKEMSKLRLGKQRILRNVENAPIGKFEIAPGFSDQWRIGIQTISEILRGQAPKTVEEIIYCLMVGNAMRLKAGSANLSEFVSDLYIWREEVEVADMPVFDDIVSVLWRKICPRQLSFISFLRPRDGAILNHFQEMFQNLLSETNIDVLAMEHEQGDRLSVINHRHAEASPPTLDTTEKSHAQACSGASSDGCSIYKKRWKRHDRAVLLLASTTVFAALIATLLLIFHITAAKQAMSILANEPRSQEPSLPLILKRNCIFIACYLGLSAQTIAEIPFDDGSWKEVPCPECGKRFSNWKRHLDSIHRRKQSECQKGCGYVGRADNTRTHEQKCAGTRTSHKRRNTALAEDQSPPARILRSESSMTSSDYGELGQLLAGDPTNSHSTTSYDSSASSTEKFHFHADQFDYHQFSLTKQMSETCQQELTNATASLHAPPLFNEHLVADNWMSMDSFSMNSSFNAAPLGGSVMDQNAINLSGRGQVHQYPSELQQPQSSYEEPILNVKSIPALFSHIECPSGVFDQPLPYASITSDFNHSTDDFDQPTANSHISYQGLHRNITSPFEDQGLHFPVGANASEGHVVRADHDIVSNPDLSFPSHFLGLSCRV